jgi:hypothetical protein
MLEIIRGDIDQVRFSVSGEQGTLDNLHSGKAPLHLAAEMGRNDIIQVLLAAQAKLNIRDNGGCPPLFWACARGQTHSIQLLLGTKPGAPGLESYNNCGMHALMAAAMNGHINTTKALINMGANQEARDFKGRTVLHKAAMWGRLPVCVLLAYRGSDITAVDCDGLTPLELFSPRQVKVPCTCEQPQTQTEIKAQAKIAMINARISFERWSRRRDLLFVANKFLPSISIDRALSMSLKISSTEKTIGTKDLIMKAVFGDLLLVKSIAQFL